jgi:hypothetical protein
VIYLLSGKVLYLWGDNKKRNYIGKCEILSPGFMKSVFTVCMLLAGFFDCVSETHPFQTVCNPVNLSYRFQPESLAGRVNGEIQSYREGADPTVVLFRDEYYAFISRSGGYFHSTDLIHWDLIVPNDVFPVEAYAPAAAVTGDAIYMITSGVGKVLKTTHPKSGIWEVVNPHFKLTHTDPALFFDDDGRLYYYAGCSDKTPITGCELDPETFEPISKSIPLISGDKAQRGWEELSDYNTPGTDMPWIEGAWMNKYNGKYYLQYASPGTQFKSYNDAVFISGQPLGPFTLATHNPFSCKPEGFICGAGHGSTFQDKYGNYWHMATSTVSKRFMFERRLSLFPLFFDADGEMYAYTAFGDYPMIIPQKKISSPGELFPQWQLLSYNKKVEVSSALSGYEAKNLCDEDIRTWWSAATGDSGEWFRIDLGNASEVYALQVNFADQDAQLYGRTGGSCYQYTVETSVDNRHWQLLIDRSKNTADMPHDYMQLPQPVKARYLRVKNVHVPSGKFSISDFRVFGADTARNGYTATPFTAKRDADRRTVHLKWDTAPEAIGYTVRYGTRKDKLYQSYMVYGENSLSIHNLNAGQEYYFEIEAF